MILVVRDLCLVVVVVDLVVVVVDLVVVVVAVVVECSGEGEVDLVEEVAKVAEVDLI